MESAVEVRVDRQLVHPNIDGEVIEFSGHYYIIIDYLFPQQ